MELKFLPKIQKLSWFDGCIWSVHNANKDDMHIERAIVGPKHCLCIESKVSPLKMLRV